MKTLLALLLLIPSLSFSDHYKTGLFFHDPYYIGCIWADDIVNGGRDCALRSPKFFFNENKHKGSMEKAEEYCYRFLRSESSDVYRAFPSPYYELWFDCGYSE